MTEIPKSLEQAEVKKSTAEQPTISEIGKKVIEGAKKISDEKILLLSQEISKAGTEFINRALKSLERRLRPEEFNAFNKAIAGYPLVDLACGEPVLLLPMLFKEKFTDKKEFLFDVKDTKIAEPLNYIGVDKYHEPHIFPKDPELKNRIKFEKKDIIQFLRTLPDDSVNIFIGGFDTDISRPKGGKEDRYRAILEAEIARVLAKGGSCLESESDLIGKWNGEHIRLKDFGLEKVPLAENTRFIEPRAKLYTKPE
ncbi:MAG: hypothetical protein A2174_01680 [Candidatus Portnoybacteria bacterium RBG_13_41_18]|uniref:Uncharacterized protein n=1 Tax=Candidatus Portnoybacteria bacterium RBG_13_41_18 TaxID=1801991 RepID=A0A1G2FBK3_9BACT|nr:MAG: hypothetical protein A2174_01680 [Candidatus Portnoybacteria bacterium RBG_13_41_18]